MHRSPVFAVALAVALTSCRSDDGAVPTAPAPTGSIRMIVDVAGHPELSPKTYAVNMGGSFWTDAAPNKPYETIASTGEHLIELVGLEPRFGGIPGLFIPTPAWCRAENSPRQLAMVEAGRTTLVTFSVTCPALEGAGTIAVTIEGWGPSLPEEFQLRATRLVGDPYLATFTVQPNKPVQLPLGVGVYSFSIASSTCKPPPTTATVTATSIFGPVLPKAVLRAGETALIRFSKQCY